MLNSINVLNYKNVKGRPMNYSMKYVDDQMIQQKYATWIEFDAHAATMRRCSSNNTTNNGNDWHELQARDSIYTSSPKYFAAHNSHIGSIQFIW